MVQSMTSAALLSVPKQRLRVLSLTMVQSNAIAAKESLFQNSYGVTGENT